MKPRMRESDEKNALRSSMNSALDVSNGQPSWSEPRHALNA